jgi:hypothetical protein
MINIYLFRDDSAMSINGCSFTKWVIGEGFDSGRLLRFLLRLLKGTLRATETVSIVIKAFLSGEIFLIYSQSHGMLVQYRE